MRSPVDRDAPPADAGPEARDERLAEVLGEWLAARDTADGADVEALAAEHPDLADELRRNVRLMEAVTASTAPGDRRKRRCVGGYELLRELGVGGMGTVYLARGGKGGLVAIKVVHRHLLQSPGFFKRFLREAEMGRRIRHENVVATLDHDAIEDADGVHHFLVMEYVEGRTLRDLVDDVGPVPEELCLHIAREVCRGLAAIHAVGAVHRDLKPENVLITPEHVVKIMDLGVAMQLDQLSGLSRAGAFVGTVRYGAPEQFACRPEDVDARADLHSLGVLLFELATGRHPFDGVGIADLVARLMRGDAPRLGEVNPQVTPFLEEVVDTLLRKDPADRFQSAAALLDVLEREEASTWWRERATAVRAQTRQPLRRVRVPRETAVYGREPELARLRAAYEAVRAGEGRVVLVEGEAGVGKTRLVDELVKRLRADGEDLTFLFGAYPPGGAATLHGALSTAFRHALGDTGAGRHLSRTPLLVPAFEAVLRGEPAPDGAVPLSKGSLATCFVAAVRGLASRRPTVLLVDDLHFAPEDALDLFTSLALAVPGHRLLLIGTTRPGLPPDRVAHLTRLEQSEQIPLGRLSPKDLALLLRDTFRSERLAEELGYRIALKSDGNPFFAFEIIRGLRESQLITRGDDGTWVSTRVIDDIRIPSSVLDLVNARVADLDDEDRALLDLAACCGYEFDALLVGEALGEDRVPVLQRFARIEKRHRLVRAAGRRFVFDHHQVQEALYDALPEVLREEYHAALARALEERVGAAESAGLDGDLCVQLAEHHLRGGRGEQASRYLGSASDHLRDGHLHAQAVELLERALAAPGVLEGVARAEVLLTLCSSYGPLDMLGRRERHESAAREAEALAVAAADDALRSRAAYALGTVLWRTARHGEAEMAFRRAHDLDPDGARPDREATFSSHLAGVLGERGRLDEALRLHRRDLALSREAGDARGEARAIGNLGRVELLLGRLDDAREHVERYLELCRAIGNREGEALAVGNLGGILYSQGRSADAGARYEEAARLCEEIGDRQGQARAAGGLGIVAAAEGRVGDAVRHQERALALSDETGYRRGAAAATLNLGAAYLSLGDLAAARARVERARRIHSETGNRPSVAIADMNLAQVEREEGDLAGAAARLRSVLATCEELGLRHLLAAGRTSLGSLLVEMRGADEGRPALEEALAVAREHGFPAEETLALCELAGLPGGDVDAACVAVAANGSVLDDEARRAALFLLWKATGEREHLDAARALLEAALERAPPERRAAMRTKVRLNRGILAAAEGRFPLSSGR